MVPALMLHAALRKGLGAIGSADALHPGWRRMWGEVSPSPDRCEVIVVPSAEVEDRNRVHHLVLMDDLSGFSALQEALAPHSPDIAATGRPRVRLTGEDIAGHVHRLGGLIGPAHAFTPWTSLYASHDSVRGCYGSEPVDFLELGLSADSSYGASIPELRRIPFLSSSDAHGPDPGRLGREYVVLPAREATPAGILESIARGRVAGNAGLFPEEGKYNRTACSRCYRQFTMEEAAGHSWRCPSDGGRIKKGVLDRARELSRGSPAPRPPYIHTVPLPEIVRHVLSRSSTGTRDVVAIYDRFISCFGNEIRVLSDIPVPELATVHGPSAFAIGSLRDGHIRLTPGGGGRYGSFSFF